MRSWLCRRTASNSGSVEGAAMRGFLAIRPRAAGCRRAAGAERWPTLFCVKTAGFANEIRGGAAKGGKAEKPRGGFAKECEAARGPVRAADCFSFSSSFFLGSSLPPSFFGGASASIPAALGLRNRCAQSVSLVRTGAFIPISARKRRASTIVTDLFLGLEFRSVTMALTFSLPSCRRSPSLANGTVSRLGCRP